MIPFFASKLLLLVTDFGLFPLFDLMNRARQGSAGQGRAGRCTARQGRAVQGSAAQGRAVHCRARQGRAG